MTGLALGFAPGPGTVRALPHTGPTADRRDRLRACLDAWRAHPAFLPLPLCRQVPLAEATRFAQAQAVRLSARLEALAGSAEALIAVHLPSPPVAEGRAWLRVRAARARIPEALSAFADRLPGVRAHAVQGLDLSLLLARADLPALRRDIAAQAQDLAPNLPPDARLHITLPWPPFSFSHLDPKDP